MEKTLKTFWPHLFFLALIIPSRAIADDFKGIVEEVAGRVYVQRNQKRIRVRKKFHLLLDDHLLTLSKGTCLLNLPHQNTFLRVAPKTNVFMDKNKHIQLQSGMIWIRKRPSAELLKVQSGPIQLQTLGSSLFFRIDPSGGGALVVKSGKVLLREGVNEFTLAANSLIQFEKMKVPEIRGVLDDEFIEWEEPFE